MKEMTWKSRLNRLFAHRFALPVLCWCAALVFWLVQGAVAFAGDSSAKAKGTLTETSIPIESWQLAELTWGEPGENSAPQGQLITTGGDPQMILEDVSGRVVRTVDIHNIVEEVSTVLSRSNQSAFYLSSPCSSS